MANDLTKNPLVIDTASGSPALTTFIRIKKIRWIGATTAGHQAIVQDQNSNLCWESVASGANYTEETDFNLNGPQRMVLSGLRVPTLGSGKLEIYI